MLTQRLESAARAILGPADAKAVAWLDQHYSAAKLHVAPEMVEGIAAAALKVSEGSLAPAADVYSTSSTLFPVQSTEKSRVCPRYTWMR